MAVHVDVVKNEWLAGSQHRLARVAAEGRELLIESDDPVRWRRFLEQLFGEDDHRSPQEVLEALAERLNGTYIEATHPHEDRDCPFHSSDVVHIAPADHGAAQPA